MKKAILGTVVGLVLGVACAFAYTYYLGDAKFLADLPAQFTIQL